MGGPGSGPRPGQGKGVRGTRKSRMTQRKPIKPRAPSTKNQLMKHMQAKYGKPSLLGRVMSKLSDKFGG